MEWGPFREKFHQYILSNLSNIVTTTVQSNLNTSFTADLAVSVAEQDCLADINGSSNSDTPYQTYLTDTTFFTAEVWLYCGILIAVIAVLILTGEETNIPTCSPIAAPTFHPRPDRMGGAS